MLIVSDAVVPPGPLVTQCYTDSLKYLRINILPVPPSITSVASRLNPHLPPHLTRHRFTSTAASPLLLKVGGETRKRQSNVSLVPTERKMLSETQLNPLLQCSVLPTEFCFQLVSRTQMLTLPRFTQSTDNIRIRLMVPDLMSLSYTAKKQYHGDKTLHLTVFVL